MARSRTVAPLVTVAILSLALGACSSSKKTATVSTTPTTDTTTSAAGGVAAPASTGANTVSVTLGDTKGLDAPMTLVMTPSSVKAGDVSFVVKNSGTIDHEMVVLKSDTAFDKLPVATGADKIDEADNAGETGEPHLKPGESKTFTVKGLAAGKYVLVCNIAKHYGLGMRAALTVS